MSRRPSEAGYMIIKQPWGLWRRMAGGKSQNLGRQEKKRMYRVNLHWVPALRFSLNPPLPPPRKTKTRWNSK